MSAHGNREHAVKQIGVYDAKTHLTRLLDEVERGETVEITRHGRPVARLVPVPSARRRSQLEVIESIGEFSRTHSLDFDPRELINEGRKR